MKKTTKNLLAAAALLAATSGVHAAIITIGSGATAPTSVPTFNLTPGQQFSFTVWGQAQGTTPGASVPYGYLQAASIGVYASSSATFDTNGTNPVISAANPLPAPSVTLLTGVSNAYPANASTTTFQQTRGTTNTTAVSGAQLVIANIGGSNPANPNNQGPGTLIGSNPGQAALISTVTATATTTPGTYYLYLGRTGSGIAESPAFVSSGTNIGASTGSNTSNFGFGDVGVYSQGTGTVANTVGEKADAIIVVASAGATISLTTPAAAPVTTVVGSGNSYQATLLGNNGSFTLGGTPSGDAIAGFDFSGDPGTISNLPAGATILTGAAAAPYITLFNSLNGGTFDTIVDLGPGNTSGNLSVSGQNAGVTVNAIAVVPEPTTISLAGIGAVLAMSRRRRQTA